jgi:hypothetical protein
MEGNQRKIPGYTIAAFLLFSMFFYPSGASYANSEEDLTSEIVFDKETLNLSRNPPAVTFQGWLNFTGYVLAPITVHLDPSSDLGCVYLSQYEFTFQTPESVAYTGLITIEIDENFTITPALTLQGTFEQAGIKSTISPSSTIIPAYYWEEEESDIPNPLNQDRLGGIPLVFALPFLLVFFGSFIIMTRSKVKYI